nr:MAG TPA: hypothetical protein [Bacteriophage sp.]
MTIKKWSVYFIDSKNEAKEKQSFEYKLNQATKYIDTLWKYGGYWVTIMKALGLINI